MPKLFPFRLSKKKTGEVTVSDGTWRMEVKERFRIIGLFTTAVMIVGFIVAFVAPYVLGFLALLWFIGTTLLSGLLDALNWARLQIWNRMKWTGRWCIKQPFLDFKYGRKKRKELEDRRTYAK